MTVSRTAKVLQEALGNYLGWDVHVHERLHGRDSETES